MKNSSTERAALRNTLLSNGYIPLPLADKGVFIVGWSRATIDRDWLEPYARVGRYPNTGLRCDDLVAFDIDVLDEALADQCEDYVEQHAGPTEFCRIGRWPKRLLLYRLGHKHRDTIRSGRTGNYGGHMAELLATHGRQFAAFGIHPGTGEPYEWDGPSPADSSIDELPEIDAQTALDVLDGLDALLAATGLEQVRAAHLRGSAGRDEYDLLPDTEVMVEGEIVRWDALRDHLTTEGVFGNLWRPEYDDWGDSDAVHYYLAHGSREPCAHDFVNDCTHWESTFNQDFADLLPPPPDDTRGNTFVHPDIADMQENCVILRDSTVRRLDDPLRAYPLAGWEQSMLHLQVADPNPPKSNPNKQIPFTKLWKMNPETLKADYAALRPDFPQESIVRLGSAKVMNTYIPPQHVAKGGETHTYYEFLAHLIPNTVERGIFDRWLSHKIQHPGDRMHGLVMVTPAFGTGRGTLTQIMARLLGERYVNNIELHDLLGTGGQAAYNELLADSLLLCVPEALEEREDISKWQARHVAYERIKVVCDPVSQPMHVKRKYARNSVEQIFASLFISSNHTDALAIEPGDRRLIVLDNTETPLVDAPDDLYGRIHAWKNSPANIAKLYHELRVAAPGYDAFGAPPETRAKAGMIEAGQSDMDRLFEIFVEQCDGDLVTAGQWRNFVNGSRLEYDLDLPADPQRRENALVLVLQQKARKIVTVSSAGIKVKGKPVRPWIVRNFEQWAGCEDNAKVRAEILRNGDPHHSNVLKMPEKPR